MTFKIGHNLFSQHHMVHPFVYPFAGPPIFPPSVRPAGRPAVRPSDRPFIDLSSSVLPSCCLSVRLSVHPSVRPSAQLPVCSSARPPVRPTTRLSCRPCAVAVHKLRSKDVVCAERRALSGVSVTQLEDTLHVAKVGYEHKDPGRRLREMLTSKHPGTHRSAHVRTGTHRYLKQPITQQCTMNNKVNGYE